MVPLAVSLVFLSPPNFQEGVSDLLKIFIISVIYPSWKTDINLAFEQANRDFFSGSAAMQLDKTNLVLNGSVGIGKTKPGNIEVTLEVFLKIQKMSNYNLILEQF